MRRVISLTAVVLAFLFAVSLCAQTSENYNFLTDLSDFARLKNMLPDYLNRIAMAQLEARRQVIARLSSPDDVLKRKAYFRERMIHDLGGLPERTPLNARVVGVLKRDGYKIEKVIFESQPRFYVTANLYVPTRGQPPYPAILFPLGHERGGKANPTWQQMLVTLARRGYVSLDWDPIGQGERVQIYDTDFEARKLGISTTEHTIQGIQCLLTGDALARYTIWDGMRALDYLLSRPEVDPTRVACTGNSGGGALTAYLAALDDRIKVAMPSCYLTSWAHLLETIGPQDAEQWVPRWLEDGLDHADFVLTFAPKPYLMLTAIRDFFSINGARETYQEAQRVYSLMGAPEKLSMFEADDGHGYTAPRRMAAYRWLSRYLKGADDNEPEQSVEPESEETLRCTDSGQVAVSLGGETISTLNLKRAEQSMPVRAPLSSPKAVEANRDQMRRQVRELIGFNPKAGSLNVKPYGTLEREGYKIEKLTYESEPGIIVPALLFLPQGGEARKPAVVYVHGGGKATEAGPGGEIELLAKRGLVVLAIDTRGTGETRPTRNNEQPNEFYRFFGDYDSAVTALLVGKTMVGMRAEDVSRGVDLLATRPEVDSARIFGFGVGSGSVVLLHEAVLDERIKKVALEDMLESYQSVVTHNLHRDVFESVVPGALRSYDFPDLVAALSPRAVWISNMEDPLGMRIIASDARKQYARALDAFKTLGAETAIQIKMTRPEEKLGAVFQESK
ncbi:MAG: alpha/beta hydrolase [Terriglobia bacterium]